MNKRGLSPLASTAILLVISIVIGVVVMTWGRSYVEKLAVEEPVPEIDESIFADLDERLRKGEITKDQYDRIKAVLLTQGS